jgi:hypothetical protein
VEAEASAAAARAVSGRRRERRSVLAVLTAGTYRGAAAGRVRWQARAGEGGPQVVGGRCGSADVAGPCGGRGCAGAPASLDVARARPGGMQSERGVAQVGRGVGVPGGGRGASVQRVVGRRAEMRRRR